MLSKKVLDLYNTYATYVIEFSATLNIKLKCKYKI